jgi:FKBP-type peptidyl-prolyl cis-trans isomerase FkpA
LYLIKKDIIVSNSFLTLILGFLLLFGAGCAKDKTCSPNTVASEAGQIQTFATTNNIAAVPHNTGLYYEVLDPGTGTTASANSNIYITYSGELLDGTVFDSQANSALTGWPLNELIEGWRVGIPLIKEGGRIRLIVPSAMAYGCTGYGTIPPDAVLFFDITLVDVD